MREQLPGRRFQGDGSQRSVEVRLVKRAEPVPCRFRIGAQPPEGELVSHDEHDQGIGSRMPKRENVRMRCGELNRGMSNLTYLGPRRKIGPGDEVEPRMRNLEVRHGGYCTWSRRCFPHQFRRGRRSTT